MILLIILLMTVNYALLLSLTLLLGSERSHTGARESERLLEHATGSLSENHWKSDDPLEHVADIQEHLPGWMWGEGGRDGRRKGGEGGMERRKGGGGREAGRKGGRTYRIQYTTIICIT